MPQPIRALLIHDNPSMREGLAASLEPENLELVAVVTSTREALDSLHRLSIGVVFIDERMPNMDGIAATRVIRRFYPETAIVLLGAVRSSESLVTDAIEAGASGYLLGGTTPADLATAAKLAVAGMSVFPTAPAYPRAEPPEGPPALSRRELEVLTMLAEGMTGPGIAEDLGVSHQTVETYFDRLRRKLRAKNRANAVAIAFRAGVIE